MLCTKSEKSETLSHETFYTVYGFLKTSVLWQSRGVVVIRLVSKAVCPWFESGFLLFCILKYTKVKISVHLVEQYRKSNKHVSHLIQQFSG